MRIVLEFDFTTKAQADEFDKWSRLHPDASGQEMIEEAERIGAVDGGIGAFDDIRS